MLYPVEFYRNRKPITKCGIRKNIALTDKLVVATLDDYNAVNGQKLDITGPLGKSVKKGNIGLYVTSTTVQYLNVPVPLLDGSNDGWTVLMLGSWSADVNTKNMFVDPDSRGVASAFDASVDVAFDIGALHGPDGEWASNTIALVGKRAKFSTKRYSVMVNEKEITGYTRSGALGNITAGTWKIGYVDSTYQNTFWWSTFLVWNRFVADEEIKAVRLNPWQLFEPEVINFPVSAGGVSGRIMGSLAGSGGLAGIGGLAGKAGGLAG